MDKYKDAVDRGLERLLVEVQEKSKDRNVRGHGGRDWRPYSARSTDRPAIRPIRAMARPSK